MNIHTLTTFADTVAHIAPAAGTTTLLSLIPPILWLGVCFFLNRKHPHRTGFLMSAFFFGALAVILSLPLETFVATLSHDSQTRIILWAASEEVLKLFAVLLAMVAYRKRLNGPRDLPIIGVTVGLGFAALENGLYVLRPVLSHNLAQAALSSWMRFLGADLLHGLTTSLIGLAIGFAFFRGVGRKFSYGMFGLGIATIVHSVFNMMVVKAGTETGQAFGRLWIVAIVAVVAWVLLVRNARPAAIASVWNESYAVHEKIFQELVVYFGTTAEDVRLFADISSEKAAAKHGELARLSAFLREQYALRLERYGMKSSETKLAAQKGVSDSLSPKIAAALFTLLKEKEHRVTLETTPLEVIGTSVDAS